MIVVFVGGIFFGNMISDFVLSRVDGNDVRRCFGLW